MEGAIHFHLLVLDGVYLRSNDRLEFRRVPPPTRAELEEIRRTITGRVGRHLQRRGWLTRDAESSQLNLDREDTVLDHLLGHSITYRIAMGPRAGQKAFTLQSLTGTPLPQPVNRRRGLTSARRPTGNSRSSGSHLFGL